MSIKLVALLPMKGHSERVPNKNIKLLAGKPLFQWILESLMVVPQIEKIVIDTDSELITAMAKSINDKLTIIDRPSSLQGDYISMNDIIAHDLSLTEEEYFIQTHSTNPLLKSATISSAIAKFEENLAQYDSLFSVTRLQTRLYNETGKPVNHDPKVLVRTQDLPPIYEENSNFYIFSRSSFTETKARIGRAPLMYPMNEIEAMDIDTLDQFKIADTVLKSQIAEQI